MSAIGICDRFPLTSTASRAQHPHAVDPGLDTDNHSTHELSRSRGKEGRMGNGTTVAFSRRILIFPVLIAFASSALAADINHLPNVSEYAKGCYGANGLDLTAGQIAMLEPPAGFKCSD